MNEDRIQLSLKDRLFLSNQYRILEALYPDEAESFKQKCIIVENGYELHYSELNVAIIENRLTVETCHEVMDILDMYRALNDSYKRLKDKEGIAERDLQFDGFDGNDGSGRLGYARFLILTQGRWQEILEERQGFDLNSHSAVIEMYRRMLSAWEKMGKKCDLSLDEIKLILAEQIHPEHRK